jgi:IstB-like ATP binding protein
VANVVEVFEHWAPGRPLQAIAESLGLARKAVRKYVRPTREAGFSPDRGAPPEGWAADGRLRHYLLPTLLILDDFAMRGYTTQHAHDLYQLITDHTRGGSIIVHQQSPTTGLAPQFPDPVLAEGALDRLLGRAHHLDLQGRSCRQFQRPDRATRPTPESALTSASSLLPRSNESAPAR